MALPHAQPLEIIDLAIEPPHPGPPAPDAPLGTSLLRSAGLQLLRLRLSARRSLPDHRLPGEASLHCLSGEVIILTPTRPIRLGPGQLLALPAGEPHSIEARVDSVLLVTLVRPPQPEARTQPQAGTQP